MAKKILDSGKAYKKFKEIISAQEGKLDFEKLIPAKFCSVVFASKSGTVKEIDNRSIAAVARAAGCPADKSAGLYLHVHVKSKIQKGKPLTTLYAETQEKLRFAKNSYERLRPITVD